MFHTVDGAQHETRDGLRLNDQSGQANRVGSRAACRIRDVRMKGQSERKTCQSVQYVLGDLSLPMSVWIIIDKVGSSRPLEPESARKAKQTTLEGEHTP